MEGTLKIKFFDELTTKELYEIVRARTEVFLMEQHIVCRDFDGVDYDSLHCFLEQDGRILAYLRAYRTEEDAVQIGRVLSIPHGKGYGTRLMQEAIPAIRRRMPCRTFVLHSQQHACGFYRRLGFVEASPVFLEEGIPHVTMTLEPD